MPDAFFSNKQINRNLKHPLRDETFSLQWEPHWLLVQESGRLKKKKQLMHPPQKPTLWAFLLPLWSLPLPHQLFRLRGGVEILRDVTAAYFPHITYEEPGLGALDHLSWMQLMGHCINTATEAFDGCSSEHWPVQILPSQYLRSPQRLFHLHMAGTSQAMWVFW